MVSRPANKDPWDRAARSADLRTKVPLGKEVHGTRATRSLALQTKFPLSILKHASVLGCLSPLCLAGIPRGLLLSKCLAFPYKKKNALDTNLRLKSTRSVQPLLGFLSTPTLRNPEWGGSSTQCSKIPLAAFIPLTVLQTVPLCVNRSFKPQNVPRFVGARSKQSLLHVGCCFCLRDFFILSLSRALSSSNRYKLLQGWYPSEP